jgi:hypothetical protein
MGILLFDVFVIYNKINITSVPKYNTSLSKSRRLIKLIVVLNLLIIGITFIILSFKREIVLMFFGVFINDCRK